MPFKFHLQITSPDAQRPVLFTPPCIQRCLKESRFDGRSDLHKSNVSLKVRGWTLTKRSRLTVVAMCLSRIKVGLTPLTPLTPSTSLTLQVLVSL